MRKVNLALDYQEYNDISELATEDNQLFNEAKKALESSYAPYSAYHVGAAVLLENGEVVLGSNQENAAYPSGLCAERVALFYAFSKFPAVPVKAIAITAKAKNFIINKPITPCGSCRQVMAESENRHQNQLKLILGGETGKVFIVRGIRNILPLTFSANELKKE
jgi:cytidine deaminase